MAWKQDLAKLKQQLGPEETPPPPPKPAPKPQPKAAASSLDDEDAVFLSAMGQKSIPPRPARSSQEEAPQETPAAPEPAPETFEEALKDLKGLKPLARGLQAAPSPQPRPPAAKSAAVPAGPAAPPPKAPQTAVSPEPPAPLPGSSPVLPLRFQLAAGMALEVDGMLDLRSHSVEDAMERLKDRLGDGLVLGWRSLQVILGPDPKLHEGLLALLASGQAPMVARYAQAPVPMGGSQAWLLYLAPPAQS